MSEFWPVLGTWLWWIVAGILLIGELIAPGIFLLWLGFAAAFTAIVDLILGLGWKGEIATFAVLSVLSVLASIKLGWGAPKPASEAPHLNNPMQAMIGRRYTLQQPINNGRGKLQIDDTLWDIDGPDMVAGSAVKVIGVNGLRLIVAPA
jgi:inner membrane protein